MDLNTEMCAHLFPSEVILYAHIFQTVTSEKSKNLHKTLVNIHGVP
jgi:hypothetical protein